MLRERGLGDWAELVSETIPNFSDAKLPSGIRKKVLNREKEKTFRVTIIGETLSCEEVIGRKVSVTSLRTV